MRFESPRREGPKPVLTPLIDVVFLLLMFFLLTGTFSAVDVFPVRPPVGDADISGTMRHITVLVSADGRVAVDNRAVSAIDFPPLLGAELNAGPVDEVTVKADAATPTGIIIGVLGTVRTFGVARVRLMTTPPR